MGKAGRWLKSFLSGKREAKKEWPQCEAPSPAATPREKRWSFRRPVFGGNAAAHGVSHGGCHGLPAPEVDDFDQKKHAVAVAVAAAAAADAAVAAAEAAAAAVRLSHLPGSLVEEAAAVRIQASFRGYLARTALCALRGIVKLQALVRGQLVRKQANATLRCMQALLVAQSRLRAQRVRALQEHHQPPAPAPRPRPPSPQQPRRRRSYEMDRSCEENAKIVEMDVGEPARQGAANDRQLFAEYHHHGRCSPAPSAAAAELSPRAYSAHFDEFSVATAQSSPPELCPSYMANTESSRAKARSQSAPRQRAAEALERQPSRRKGTPPRSASVRMQRSSSSSSHAGAAARGGGGGLSPWSGVRLGAPGKDRDSECASTTSSVVTAATVYSRTRSLVGFEVRRGLY
ncbi:hypothetical protein ACP4OV_004681 [Aristida adscensionis]